MDFVFDKGFLEAEVGIDARSAAAHVDVHDAQLAYVQIVQVDGGCHPNPPIDGPEGAVATELVQGLLQGDGGEALPILSSLVDAVSDRDRALLDDLERLIRRKRRATERSRNR